jgi:predicted phosphodiesterase
MKTKCFILILIILLLSFETLFAGGRKKAPAAILSQEAIRSNFNRRVPPHDFDIILGRPTDHSITISMLTYKDMDLFFEYGTEPGNYTQKTALYNLKFDEPIEVLIDTLKPDTQYYYCMQYKDPAPMKFSKTEEYTFHTQRSPGSTFVFNVQADPHLPKDADDPYEVTLNNVLMDKPDFYIDLGDTFQTDRGGTEYMGFHIQRSYLGKICHSTPFFFVLGNHDGEQGHRLNGTPNNLTINSATLRKKYIPNPFPNTFYTGNQAEEQYIGILEDYYAWKWGDAQFIVLDPFWYTTERRRDDNNWYWTLGQDQYQWFRKTMETSDSKFKFIFIHNLVGGHNVGGTARGGIEVAGHFEWGGHNPDGSYAFNEKRPGWGKPIHQILVENKASIVFHGHDHFYVKQDLDGVVYLECPSPTKNGLGNFDSYKEWKYLTGVALRSPGHMRITVSPDKVVADYIYSSLDKEKNRRIEHSFTVEPGDN